MRGARRAGARPHAAETADHVCGGRRWLCIPRGHIGALPFLLPLLLQIGFNFTAFQSGLFTISNVVGAMGMKTIIPIPLHRFPELSARC